MELRRTQLDISILEIENSVSNSSGMPFPDGLETDLSVSNLDFSYSVYELNSSYFLTFKICIKILSLGVTRHPSPQKRGNSDCLRIQRNSSR